MGSILRSITELVLDGTERFKSALQNMRMQRRSFVHRVSSARKMKKCCRTYLSDEKIWRLPIILPNSRLMMILGWDSDDHEWYFKSVVAGSVREQLHADTLWKRSNVRPHPCINGNMIEAAYGMGQKPNSERWICSEYCRSYLKWNGKWESVFIVTNSQTVIGVIFIE